MKSKLTITLTFLFIAALFGWLLRLAAAGYISFNYKHFLHTHSHVALLGWVYNACLILTYESVLKKTETKTEKWLFGLTQISILGMLFSFPFQGYAFYSILFSTLYIFISYGLIVDVYKQTRRFLSTSNYYLKWGGFYLFLSSIGPFALGYFMAKDMGGTIWYPLSIYWFLHFLFNGFFLFTIFGYAAKKIESKTTQLKALKRAFYWMNSSVLPLFALSVLWTNPNWYFYAIAGIGAILQIIALYELAAYRALFSIENKWAKRILQLALIAYGLKLIFQVMGAIPAVQTFINATTPFTVIGFIHLVMLGFFSLGLYGIFIKEKYLTINTAFKVGILLFIVGIIGSEILLFGQGLSAYFFQYALPNYSELLLWVSSLLPIGIGLSLFGLLPKSST